MSHEIESAMFVSQPAWHGLGTVLDHPPTVAEAIQAAGLNWSVKLSDLFLADGTPVKERYAVLRESDRKILGTVGRGFRTVQNSAAFDWFQSFLDAGLVDLEAAGSLRGGSRVWVLAKVRNGHSQAVIVPQSDDTITNHLLLAHGHDGSLAIHLGITPTRVVCANTLSAAIGERTSLRIRHTQGAGDALSAAKEVIERANGQFDRAAEVYRALAKVYVRSGAQIRAYVEQVFPAPRQTTPAPRGVDAMGLMDSLRSANANAQLVAEVLDRDQERKSRVYDEVIGLFESGRGNDLPGVKGTAWAAYNAVTEYLTHERGRNADNRVNTAWFGPEGPRAIQAAADTFLG